MSLLYWLGGTALGGGGCVVWRRCVSRVPEAARWCVSLLARWCVSRVPALGFLLRVPLAGGGEVVRRWGGTGWWYGAGACRVVGVVVLW